MPSCTHCNTEVIGNYCSNCGQAVKLKRIDAHYILHEIEHVLHFEKGILYTIRELLVRPGKNVQDFITKNRSRLVKPIIFIIVTSLIYSLISHYFHVEDNYSKFDTTQKTTTQLLFKWVADHYGYANILMGVLIAFFLKLFFRKYSYNFFELLILLCFVMGMGMLILALFALIEGITHINLMTISALVGIVYCAWAIGQFFDGKKAVSYIKALAAYFLGTISFYVVLIVMGRLVDFLKH